MTKSTTVSDNAIPEHWALTAISEDRLSYYLLKSNGNLNEAMSHYNENLRFSSDLYQWLALAEVVLRNALVKSISSQVFISAEFDPFLHIWQDLRPEERADYERAASRVISKSREATPGRVIAELNFGFWKYLLAADYEHTLWTRNFRHSFVYLKKKDRHIVYSAVERVNQLRNRVAHHERLLDVDLSREIQALFTLLGWISPEALAWARENLPKIG